ncbi:MAG: type II toxin-antitoxin system RelE/ParE family toxin [Ekhidna sp.]|nr:type II toxin-antitoxin system RelE/ParE family toxin [Ekhidna sp.]
MKRFEVSFLEEAVVFLDHLDEKAREKIIYNVKEAQMSNDKELFKKLTNDIWEFRTRFKKTYYRLFAFRDKTENTQTLVLTTHGLVKKTGKTPKAEIKYAEQIRKRYFENK